MKDYPNGEALRKAHRIYLDAMRPFIIRCLKRIQGRTLEDLIRDVSDYEPNDDIETLIDINNIPLLVRNHWNDIFNKEFNSNLNVRNTMWLVLEGRNFWAHPGKEDVDPEATRMHLSLAARVLGEIKNGKAKQAVESIRDQLFSDKVEEHPLEVENAAFKENLADMTKQLDAARAENAELEKQLKAKSNRLEEVEAEWLACDERLETVSTQLKITVAEKTVTEKRLSDISNRFADVEVEKAELEKRLEIIKRENAQLKERLKPPQPEYRPVNPNTPDSVTFQGTTFIKHLDKYRVVGDAITQSFWNYWHSLGPEGKEEMRDAGWSVEKIDDDYWEITVSSEDFQAWIEDEVTELKSLLDSSRKEKPSTQSTRTSYERTSLPTVKEMVQPALELFADRKEHRRVEMINLLTEHFSLDDDERRYLSKTGQSEKYLMSEGLIERTRTGYYRITTYGLKVVDDVPF